jgi:hypothetical protein
VTVTLLASADGAPTPDVDLALGTLTRAVRLAPGQSRAVAVRVRFPAKTAAPGAYLLLASASGPAVSVKNVAQGAAPVTCEAPAAQLVAAPPVPGAPAPGPVALAFGRRASLALPVVNLGNVPADGPLDLELRLSTDGSLANSLPLAVLTGVRAAVAAGSTRPLHLSFDRPDTGAALPPGTYTLLVKFLSSDAVLASVGVTVG